MTTPGPNELKVLLELTIASEQTTENAAQVKRYCFKFPRGTPLPTLQYLADRAMDHLQSLESRAGKSVRFELMSAEYKDESFDQQCVAMEQEAVCANVGDRLAKYEVKVKPMPETSRATPVPEIPVNVQQQQPSLPANAQQQQRPQSLFSQYGNAENVARIANPSQSASRPKPSIPRPETGRNRFQDVAPLSQPRQIQPQNPPPMLDRDNEDWDFTPSKVTYQRDERHLNEPEVKPNKSAPSGNVKLDEGFENSGFGAGNQSTVLRPYSKPQNPKAENSANVFGTSGAEFGKASKTATTQGKNEAKETQSELKWGAILPKVALSSEAKAPESNAAEEEEKLSPEPEQKEESSELVAQNVRTKREQMMQNVEKREKKPVSKARSRADRPALELSDSEDETTPDQNEIQKSPSISQSQTISVDSTGSGSSGFCNSGFSDEKDLARPVSEPPQPKYAFGMAPGMDQLRAAFSEDTVIRQPGRFNGNRNNGYRQHPRQNTFRNRDGERQSGSSRATVTANRANVKRAEIDLNQPWTQAESAAKNEEDHPRAEDTQEPANGKLEIVFNSAQEEEWGGPAW